MNISAQLTALDDVLPWRDLFREEMNCQVVHDSIHRRPGWTNEYFLRVDDTPVGYGSVAVSGPWKDKPTIYELYVLPQYRSRAFDLFQALWEQSSAGWMEVQTNNTLLAVMLHTFARDIGCEKIVFEDQLATTLSPPGAVFRRGDDDDRARMFSHQYEPQGDWVLEVAGEVAASGGIMYHYNRPYGDIYMEVAEPFRRRGSGSYLVQELKRVCYQEGSVPCARCNPTNVASRKTLQKAGFVPCGLILYGTLPARTKDSGRRTRSN